MLAVLLNVIAIVVGSLLGCAVGKLVNDDLRRLMFQAIGLAVIGMSIVMSFNGLKNWMASSLGDSAMIIFSLSLVAGSLLGAALGLDKKIEALGSWVQSKVAKQEDAKSSDKSSFVEAFVSASILFGVGTMAVLGPLQAGLGDNSILYAKSVLDGVSAVILASALGIGTAFSALPILVIQGSIALLASFLSPYLGDVMIASISAVGGVLLLAVALSVMQIKEMKIVQMLPALLIAPLLSALLS